MSGGSRDSPKKKAPDPIRNKIISTFCATCLSRDRKLYPIEGLNFDEFCADIPLSENEDRVCWECKAIAVKMNEFRYKACKAQAILQNMIRRKKCDMLVHSLSELKMVNRSDCIMIGYEVDTDNTQSDVQVSIDFPKREVEDTEPDNPLSPDVDYMDSNSETDEKEKLTNQQKIAPNFVACEEVRVDVDSDAATNSTRRPKRSRTSRTPKNHDSDSEDDAEDRRQSSRKRKLGDDDHFVAAPGPSSSNQQISLPSGNQLDTDLVTDALKTLRTLKTCSEQSEPGLLKDTNKTMYKMLEKMTAKLLTSSNYTESTRKVMNVEPIDSVAEFDHLEKRLNDPEFEAKQRKSLSYFCTSGIGTGINNAYEIIDRLFTRKFLTTCSWSGGSRGEIPKIRFRNYQRVIELFFSVILESDPTITLQTVETFLKMILKNATKRCRSRKMRKSTPRFSKGKKNVLCGENLELLLEQATQAAGAAEPTEQHDEVEVPKKRERANSVY